MQEIKIPDYIIQDCFNGNLKPICGFIDRNTNKFEGARSEVIIVFQKMPELKTKIVAIEKY